MTNFKKLLTIIIFILVIIILGTASFIYYGNVKERKLAFKSSMDYYNNIIKSEQKWLANQQLSNGALAFRGKENGIVRVVPYFSSITALALLQKAPELEYENVVKDYIEWHFAHLNNALSDKYGVAGTIYDYSIQVRDGVVSGEKTEQDYDSVDSYAALFLTVLWDYYEATGDKEYLIKHYQQITDVVGAINSTMDKDGLSYAKPNKQVKYLMDNAEVFQGLSCAINLYEKVFLPHYDKKTSEYSAAKLQLSHLLETKKRQENALRTKFWNIAEERYEIGIDNDGSPLKFSGFKEFYPDAVAQLFPMVFGVVEPESKQARKLYKGFGEYFAWENLAHYEQGSTSFYWGLTAYCGALMGDEQKVRAYLEYYLKNVAPEHKYPAYNADVAWVVLASAKMASLYQEQMKKIDPLGIIKVQ